jgi:glutathione peroxidase
MKSMFILITVFIAIFVGAKAFAGKEKEKNSATSPLDFKMKTIDGDVQNLSAYKGNVVLIVNVASKCGNTPQYQALQDLYGKYKDQGFIVLGFPANDFGAQEPGTDSQIREFCTANYGVTFPMFSKISVVGKEQHPLYAFLTSAKSDPQFAGDITWNFTKFLLDRDGRVIARFAPKTKPDTPEVVAAIEKVLAIAK